jgi:hypothetical protein
MRRLLAIAIQTQAPSSAASGKNSRNFHTLGYEMGNFQKLVFFHTQMVLFQTIIFF